MLNSKVKRFHHKVFINKSHHNVLVLLKSLQHVKAKLEGRLVIRVRLFGVATAQLDQNSGKLH
jgi:hypothetical protein